MGISQYRLPKDVNVPARLRAEILLDMDANAVEEAEALFGQSLEIARRQEAKTFEQRAEARAANTGL